MNQERSLPIRSISSDSSDVINLGQLFGVLWRGKWLIGLITAICVILATYYAFAIATPLYRSSAVVILETDQQSVVDLQSVVGGISGDTSAVNSEVEVLRARSLMEKVVARLDLTNDPEFNADLREPGLRKRIRDRIEASIFGDMNAIPALNGPDAERRQLDRVVNALLERLTIRNLPLSLVFSITAETTDPIKSALIADTVVELYILNQLEVKFEATEQATSWLSGRVAELQVQLEEAEARVKDFNAATDLVSVEALQGLERQLKDIRDRVVDAEISLTTAQATLSALQAAPDRTSQADVTGDPQLARFLPRVDNDTNIATAFDTRFEQLRARAELEATRADQQLTALRNSILPLDEQIRSQGQDLIALQQLQREAEANRLLYEYFLGRLKETSAQEGIQQADSRILSDAVLPNAQASPRRSLIMALSGIVGILIGSAYVLLREGMSNGFRTARELEAETGVTVLGQIPLIPARSRNRVLTYLSEKPTSAAAEAIRNLRTSVLLSEVNNPPQVIISTSSMPGEGKTTNSLALSQNLIGMGKSVLLVEGDIRRQTLIQYFSNVPKHGLVSILNNDKTLAEAVSRPTELDLDVLFGERTDTNAADVFASQRFTDLVKEMRDTYDYIIIDTPPVLIVPDARIIAQQADATLFTVKWDSTSREQVAESMRLFRDSHQTVTGLVLSQISPRGMKRYGYGGEYGAYAGYGSKYYNN